MQQNCEARVRGKQKKGNENREDFSVTGNWGRNNEFLAPHSPPGATANWATAG